MQAESGEAAGSAPSGLGVVMGEDGVVVKSELGTREHWDEVYARECENFDEFGDEGEVWFGYPVLRQVSEWVADNISRDARIIEVGCGNATLLVDLHEHGFEHLAGTDYSEAAIRLATAVAKREGCSLTLSVKDLLDVGSHDDLGTFDVVLDKGTFDAIALGADESRSQAYRASVARMLAEGGRFVITSCNFTEEELVAVFGGLFALTDRVEYEVIEFGGRTGSTVVTVVFTKR